MKGTFPKDVCRGDADLAAPSPLDEGISIPGVEADRTDNVTDAPFRVLPVVVATQDVDDRVDQPSRLRR